MGRQLFNKKQVFLGAARGKKTQTKLNYERLNVGSGGSIANRRK